MFEANFKSLREYQCPDWFRDAKFGIWSHWGPQSVPMFGDWYAKKMYIQGSQPNLYHVRHYGHPSEFGWKDVCALWKAEKFDPDELMGLYYKAGARYFVAQAMHHDNFFNYDSKVNRFNSVNVGPGKDICSMWQQAAKKYNLPFGLTEHLGASFSWWKTNKYCDTYGPYKGVPYDGCNPDYSYIYYDNQEHVEGPASEWAPWYTTNKKFHKYWADAMEELIEKFKPDLLYSDGPLPFGRSQLHGEQVPENVDQAEEYQCGLTMLANLYNTSIEKNGTNQAVYAQKDRRETVYKVGVLDIEKSQLPGVLSDPWQTDTCIGNWFYDAKQPYKKPAQIIEMLVDIISKNGTMLLNILQRPDGTIDDEARYILGELAKWFEVCSEGVYGTRPWKVFGEGDTRVLIDGFTENKTSWNSSDYRFTTKDGYLYAFIMCPPENGVAVIKSLIGEKVESVNMLGVGEIPFSQEFGVLAVKLPEKLPTEYTNCLKIKIK